MTAAEAPEEGEILDLVRAAWGWTGLEAVRVIETNAFGNLLIEDAGGQAWRIIPEDPSCDIAADNMAELNALQRDPEFRFDWDMKRIVDYAQKALGVLVPGYVYHLNYPTMLGGKFEPSNIRVAPLRDQIRFSGDVARQIKERPEGAKITLRVID